YKPTSGDILYRGSSLLDQRGEAAKVVRRNIQGVFQDPYSSLNPTMTVGQSLAEVLKVHKVAGRQERSALVTELLQTVGLPAAARGRRPPGGGRRSAGATGSVLAPPERWRPAPKSSSPTSRCQRSMCRSRHRC